MFEHVVIAILCVLFGVGLALGYIKYLRGSLKRKWPKANPEAWKDKDENW